jgi:hypothetical protein
MDGNKMDFEIKINGTRDGQSITPEQLDIDELIAFMENAKNILYSNNKDKPRIYVKVKKGSVRFIYTAATTMVIQAHALLAEVNNSKQLTILNPKQQEAIKFFQKYAIKNHVTINLGKYGHLENGLSIDKQTKWKIAKPVWVKTELFLDGKVTNIGGKSKPNIHLDTKDFGNLTITASEKYLATDKKNRIYKKQRVRIELMQNLEDLTYDLKSAKLIEFIDYENIPGESIDNYLAKLIKKSSKDWEGIEDSETWLNEIRGYE